MRFGNVRGVTIAFALVSAMFMGGTARADWFHHAIPKVAPAVDYRTGGEFFAPPVPYGHYAKDGTFGIGKHIDSIHGHLAGLKGHLSGLGNGLGHGDGSGGCANCGDNGHGHGHSHGNGLGLGGLGHGGNGGLFSGCANGDCGGAGLGGNSHMFAKKHFGKKHGLGSGCSDCAPIASAQSPAPIAAPQAAVVASSQASPCGIVGCGGKSHHHHGSNAGCGLCGGNGLGFGKGLFQGCGTCGGRGCGACGGKGFLGNTGCGACGGKGCGSCLGGLGNGVHGLAGKAHGALYGLLHPHAGKVKYFVGAGGPVPITPGYVNYVNPVRSPRDFFAFPPFSPVE